MNLRGIVEKIEAQQFTWFGHVNGMKENGTAKIIWEMEMDDKRRGIPKCTWNFHCANAKEERTQLDTGVKQ